jgi:hypothetical protein
MIGSTCRKQPAQHVSAACVLGKALSSRTKGTTCHEASWQEAANTNSQYGQSPLHGQCMDNAFLLASQLLHQRHNLQTAASTS